MNMIESSASGIFACTFTVPNPTSAGNQIIQAFDTPTPTTPNATANFVVTVPSISLTPPKGPSGGTVEAFGTGFTPGVSVSYSAAGATVGNQSYCAVGPSGEFSECTFTVSGTGGLYSLVATGSDGAFDMATEPYTLT